MEKVEYFVVQPSIKTFGGIRVDKETAFETYNDDKTVHQTMKDLVLTTEIKRESEYNGMTMKEESKLETTVPEGTVLIWGEDTGYIVPNYHMVKVEEAIKSLEQVRDITVPIEENNKPDNVIPFPTKK